MNPIVLQLASLQSEVDIAYAISVHHWIMMLAYVRVHASPEKTEKTWNFIVAFSRTGMSWKKPLVLEISGNLLDLSKKKLNVWQMIRRINIL